MRCHGVRQQDHCPAYRTPKHPTIPRLLRQNRAPPDELGLGVAKQAGESHRLGGVERGGVLAEVEQHHYFAAALPVAPGRDRQLELQHMRVAERAV